MYLHAYKYFKHCIVYNIFKIYFYINTQLNYYSKHYIFLYLKYLKKK